MRSYMEIIYLDSDDQARQTDLEYSAPTNAGTLALFRSFRIYAVDIKVARFLLDYHNAKGDLADTIALDEHGFTAITSQRPKSETDYREIDRKFWEEVRAAPARAA